MASDDPVILWNARDPLGGRTPAEFEEALRALVAGRAEAAYVFGSYGTPEFGRDSDVDVFRVVRTEKPFLDRIEDFRDVQDLVPSRNLLVYTPEEFESLTRDPSPGFWTSAAASMRKIYG